MIIREVYDQTPELTHEMAAAAQMVLEDRSWHPETLDSYTVVDEFYKAYFSSVPGREFRRATSSFKASGPLDVLDLGAGRGETSLYLANLGHRVFPVEPSFDFCRVIEHVGRRFGLDLTIYSVTAECVSTDHRFDVAIFNCSLHHCDDPVGALKNAHKLLRPGGRLLVVGEPILPFFKSKRRTLQKMLEHPEVSGDYGGNEHVYRFSEYDRMIKQAGFHDVRSDLSVRYQSTDLLPAAMGGFPRGSWLRSQLKRLYLRSIAWLWQARLTPVLTVMKRLSLLQSSFTAVR